jgi:hypothetical protein
MGVGGFILKLIAIPIILVCIAAFIIFILKKRHDDRKAIETAPEPWVPDYSMSTVTQPQHAAVVPTQQLYIPDL